MALWVISFLNTDSVFRVSNQNPHMEATNDSAQGHTCSDTAKALTMMAGALKEKNHLEKSKAMFHHHQRKPISSLARKTEPSLPLIDSWTVELIC